MLTVDDLHVVFHLGPIFSEDQPHEGILGEGGIIDCLGIDDIKTKFGIGEVGTGEVGIGEVGIGEVTTVEPDTGEIGSEEVGTDEVGIGEVGVGEVGTGEVGTGEVDTGEVGQTGQHRRRQGGYDTGAGRHRHCGALAASGGQRGRDPHPHQEVSRQALQGSGTDLGARLYR